jgi:hypothetical protein
VLVLALEPLRGLRVVATPAALDAARWAGDDPRVLRFSPDEAFAIGATDCTLDDPDAIVLDEVGFVGAWVDLDRIHDRIEWSIPAVRDRTLVQGSIAGIPAKLWFPDDARALLVVHAAYAADLRDRLGPRW